MQTKPSRRTQYVFKHLCQAYIKKKANPSLDSIEKDLEDSIRKSSQKEDSFGRIMKKLSSIESKFQKSEDRLAEYRSLVDTLAKRVESAIGGGFPKASSKRASNPRKKGEKRK